jgi:Dynein heavy chain, N-terminal region 1
VRQQYCAVTFSTWVVSQVLAESEQMRREADNIGPRVELEHWKMRTAKFNYICEQIKSKQFKAVIGILHVAKSKLITVSFSFYHLTHQPIEGCYFALRNGSAEH